MNRKIKALPVQDRPKEKLDKIGAENMTDTELLAIIINTGYQGVSSLDLAQNIIAKYGSLQEMFVRDPVELEQIKGIGKNKAATLKVISEVSTRLNFAPEKNLIEIKKPYDAYKFVRKDLCKKGKEYLYIICLNTRHVAISKDLISIGTLNEALVHPREIYKRALERSAASVILVHNHPSGDVKPSSDDIATTERIYKVGKEIGIPLLDHVIVSDSEYFSLRSANIIKYAPTDAATGRNEVGTLRSDNYFRHN